MTQLDCTMVGAAQKYQGIQKELSCPAYQFCSGPSGYTRVVVERVKGKIIITFLLIVLIFILMHDYLL